MVDLSLSNGYFAAVSELIAGGVMVGVGLKGRVKRDRLRPHGQGGFSILRRDFEGTRNHSNIKKQPVPPACLCNLDQIWKTEWRKK